MRVHGWCVWMALSAAGCAGAPTRDTKDPSDLEAAAAKVPVAEVRGARSDKQVEVQGLEGTLSAYDVRDTMNRRLDALAQCQQQSIRKVRQLSGRVLLAIHVKTDGSVSQVDVVESDLGDRNTEHCIAQVTLETPFPKPHGGEADVTWDMILDPLSPRPPATYEPEQLEEALELGLPDLAELCEMTRKSPKLTMTAYVAPSGKVITAGAASQAKGHDALLTCAAAGMQDWRLPKPRGVAKVQFEARYRPPLNDKQRAAIQTKYANKRKAELKRKKAEAKRKRKRAKRKPSRGAG